MTSGGAHRVADTPAGMVRRPHFLTMSVNVSKMNLRIVCDSREQAPYRFEGYPCTVETATLASGDYTIFSFTEKVAIERKSLPDLVACLGVERERFARELSRLRGYDCAAIVIESSADDLRAGHYRARLNPDAAWQSVLAFTQRYRIPFIFCDDRSDAERTAFDILRHYQHDRMRELQALRIPARIAPAATERRGPGVGMDRDGNAPERRQRAGGIPHPTTTTTGTRP